MFLVSHGLLFVVSVAAWICILTLGNLAHKSLVNFVMRRQVAAAVAVPAAASELVADVAIAGISR